MKRDSRMTREEVMAEVEWLLDFGIHPLYIAQQLGRSIDALTRMAYRAENRRVFSAFNATQSRERHAREKEMA